MTEHDCRMLLSYCRLLVEMRRKQEAHALCIEGLRLAGGLEVVLRQDGKPTGDFVDARTHEAMQRLLAELKAAEERETTLDQFMASDMCPANFFDLPEPEQLKIMKAFKLRERGDDTARVLEASGRAVCDAHYTVKG
eukprot:COSAG06_NODE_9503_length_1885_cov_2.578947_2_plen_136_part_01